MVDLQLASAGDLWSYLAALGPLLDPGVSGRFNYSNGTQDTWSYHAGKVFWNGVERPEDALGGPAYVLRRPAPPITVLMSRATLSAGELIAVMFAEHGRTRRFGQPTAGAPNETFQTELSDGAILTTSNAYGLDTHGTVYDSPLMPDQRVATDWANPGTLRDPVVRAATTWLAAQRGCGR